MMLHAPFLSDRGEETARLRQVTGFPRRGRLRELRNPAGFSEPELLAGCHPALRVRSSLVRFVCTSADGCRIRRGPFSAEGGWADVGYEGGRRQVINATPRPDGVCNQLPP